MQSAAKTAEEYMNTLPEDRKKPMTALRNAVLRNLPPGFEEDMQYGMLTYIVPHSLYPPGYHVNPKQPIGLIGLASQKNFIAVYHMGIFADNQLLDWFKTEYTKQGKGKLDMGKSCIRFKKMDQVPYELIGDLASKMTVPEWIQLYESKLKP